MPQWITILGMVAVTYSVRLSVIVLLGEANMPQSVNRALRFVPPAAFSAIVFPALFLPDGTVDASPGNVRLIAGLFAALAAWYSKNTFFAIAVGMGLLWILQ